MKSSEFHEADTGDVPTAPEEGESPAPAARRPTLPPAPISPGFDPERGTPWGRDGRFVIRERLGRGGMGTVYLATDTVLARPVALKVLHKHENTAAEEIRSRVLREARIAARVENDRIARVYDVGEHDGFVFVAMEYVRGVTLRAWSATARTPKEVLSVLEQIALALSTLHQQGVIHRDLKPENVMLTEAGAVKVLDFGVAGCFEASIDSSLGRADTALPLEGTASHVVGTPAYMAPEQWNGGHTDARADVFALGVIAYELVTGELPFRGASLPELAMAVVSREVEFTPRAWRRFPPEFATLVGQMLARSSAGRVADGAAVVAAIARAMSAPREKEALSPPLPGRTSSAPPNNFVNTQRSIPAPRGSSLSPTVLAERLSLPPGSFQARAVAMAAIGLIAIGAAAGVHRFAARKKQPHTIPGMVYLEGGTFTMGRTPEEGAEECRAQGADCRPEVIAREQPAHEVTIDPFYLDVNEVTNREFAEWLKNVPRNRIRDDSSDGALVLRLDSSDRPVIWLRMEHSGIDEDAEGRVTVASASANKPVVRVSWDAAHFYCQAQAKRLPTEAEWEFAARGKTKRRYPWGDAPPACDRTVYGRGEEGPLCSGLPRGPQEISESPQDWTPDGIHDLFGNVQEWVEDAFVVFHYADCGACTNPIVRPPPEEPDAPRIVRGGAWSNSIFGGTSARARYPRQDSTSGIGFRCALSVR